MKYTKKLEYRTFYADESISFLNLRFENDVNMYGTQANMAHILAAVQFENDVNMYGTQAIYSGNDSGKAFEKDVNLLAWYYAEEVLSHVGTESLFL